jgi:hypothetical protein
LQLYPRETPRNGPSYNDLQKWFFHSRSGVGVAVTNYLKVGLGVGTGLREKIISRMDLGVDFLLCVFFLSLFSTHQPGLLN